MTKVASLPKNKTGRDFVVGDIHGAYDVLEEALAEVNFDPEKDRLFSVGDLIDRGPHSEKCLSYLQKSWFYAIRGNHEEMFLELFDKDGKLDVEMAMAQRRNGMGWVLEQDIKTLHEIKEAFEKLPLAMEFKTAAGKIGIVHADVPPGMDWKTLKKQLEKGNSKIADQVVWSRDRITSEDKSGVKGVERVFLGHTPVRGGPKRLGNCFYIDTGGVFRNLPVGDDKDFALTLCEATADKEKFDQAPREFQKKTNIISV